MLATEVSKPAVATAGENLAANGVSNVAIARLTAEELGTAWRGERSFERLRLAGVDLAAMSFSTILVSTAGPPDLQSQSCWHAGRFRPALAGRTVHRADSSCGCPDIGERPGCQDFHHHAGEHRRAAFAASDVCCPL